MNTTVLLVERDTSILAALLYFSKKDTDKTKETGKSILS